MPGSEYYDRDDVMSEQEARDYRANRLAYAATLHQRKGGRVERAHQVPHRPGYTNAAHSWGVAMLVWNLYPNLFPVLAIYALGHDVGEGVVGDFPSPTVAQVPGLKEMLGQLESDLQADAGLPREDGLSPELHHILKSCDWLELWLWAREQIELEGNHYADEVYQALQSAFNKGVLHSRAHDFWCFTAQRDVKPAPTYQTLDRVLNARNTK